MTRSAVRVRPAAASDLEAVLALSSELRGSAGSGRAGARVAAASGWIPLGDRYTEALHDPERRLVLAVDEADQPLGMAVLSQTPAPGLSDDRAVQMSHVVVADRHRRRGAGKALVAAAAAYADEMGLESVAVSVPPTAREANRFYARLGFAPMAIRRVAPVTLVRRRLAGQEVREQPPARRRSLRGSARARGLLARGAGPSYAVAARSRAAVGLGMAGGLPTDPDEAPESPGPG